MNWKAFLAMLARDAHVARRNFVALLSQTFLQPLMFVFIFGRVMVGSGYMPPSYKSLLLPGIMAICMVGTGIWAVAMPLIAEFQFTREIEDRLLAPMIFFGCTYYPWSALEKFPVLQKAVLVNPLVYASEGLRATMIPQFPHLPLLAVVVGLVFFNALLLVTGLRNFHGKSVT